MKLSFEWIDLKSETPAAGAIVVATDFKARWLDRYYPNIPMTFRAGDRDTTATHWWPIPSHQIPQNNKRRVP